MPFRMRRDDAPTPAASPPRADSRQAVYDGLTSARARISGRVPMEVFAEVGLIIESLGPLLAAAPAPGDGLGSSADTLDMLRRIATDYLPGALDAYLRLPREHADCELLPDGRTAKEALLTQLAILRQQVDDASGAALRGDTDALLVSQRFLESRFGAADGHGLQL
ncbi:MAG TPA: hypothetical protein VFO60_05900 [Candidatus Dormibacteraeota bacterium]|nr:hypothetical protein [Candidatus Dormibacteraeota bacterium]